MKFCRSVGNSYPHISTNFCSFILMFNFPQVPIVFTLSKLVDICGYELPTNPKHPVQIRLGDVDDDDDVVQGGGRGDRPDPASSSRPVHGVDSSRAVHRADADAAANPTPAVYDTENALPNCMLSLLLPAIRSLERRAKYLFYCMFFCLFAFLSTISQQPACQFMPIFACGRTLVPDVSSPFLGVSGPPGGEGEMKFQYEVLSRLTVQAVEHHDAEFVHV